MVRERIVIWMLIFLALVALVAGLLFSSLRLAFAANPVFNGMIIGVLAVGIVVNFRQVLRLSPEHQWLDQRRGGAVGEADAEPRLLASLARMLGAREGPMRLSAMATRSVLDGIRLRLDESRDISRYVIGLLIFLGLLGTFWGLLDTVTAASKVISGLNVNGPEGGQVFEQLKQNLQGPLSGMGTAFSSSLFGLAGALILGFLDLQAGHAENRFFKDLEDWLSELTHLSGGLLTEGEGSVPAYIEALLEKTADSLETLQRILGRSEEDRSGMREQMLQLATRLAELADQVRSDKLLSKNLARQQQDLQPLIVRLAEATETASDSREALTEHLHSMDANLARLVEESATGRAQTVDELRQELRLLARTIAGKDTSKP